MKKINYRQYYYDDYVDMELRVPDECTLYAIGRINISQEVKDIGAWTKAYALLCPTEFKHSILLGNVYFNYLDNVLITDSEVDILDIESAPRFNGVYFVRFKDSGSRILTYFKRLGNTEVNREINSIGMLKKLTYTGIEASNVSFGDWITMDIINIKFERLFIEEFTTDKKISDLFLKESEKIYKLIINNEIQKF